MFPARYLGALVLLAGLVGLATFSGCQQRRELATTEAESLGWWIEDVAHGVPRRPGELETEDSSAGLARVALWAQGASSPSGDWEPPRQLASRRERWSLLRRFMQQGWLGVADNGRLAVLPSVGNDDRDLIATTVEAENSDRGLLDITVLGWAKADDEATRRFKSAVRTARLEHDTAGGAKAVASTPYGKKPEAKKPDAK